jgi:hypothetical protein
MAVREGFKRIRAVLAVLSVLWLVFIAWALVVGAAASQWLKLFPLLGVLPVGVIWGLLWVIEGFVVKAGDK